MPTVQAMSMTHKQDTAAAEWIIDHNFGRHPAVSVAIQFNGQLQVVLPREVQHVNPNRVAVRFSAAQSGEARLV